MKNIQFLSKYLNDKYIITRFNDDYFKLTYLKYPVKNTGFDEDPKYKPDRNVNEEKLDNNISRARSKIFEYAMCNDFDYFITLTLKDDRYNLANFIKGFGQHIRDERKRTGSNIQYLLIPEKHLDGAYHMHGLIKGIPGEQLIINKYGYLDWKNYSDKFGYCSIDKVRDKEKVSKYITKYISKNVTVDLRGEKEKKLYYVTRGLKTAEKVKEGYLSSTQLDEITFNFENKYVGILDLNGLQYLKLKHQLDTIIP